MGDALKTQVLVIGGGPGGYVAAFRAADLGMEVAIVEDRPHLGGVCLHRGCIPSKALLHAAKLIFESAEAFSFGISFGEPQIDLDALRAWKNSSIDKIAAGLSELARLRKVQRITGRATFTSSRSVRVDGAEITGVEFEHAIIATGSRPINLPGLDPGDPWVMDSTEALELTSIPERLLVVGGGYIGFELGTVYAALGSAVTVVEMSEQLLSGADRDLAKPVIDQAGRIFHGTLTRTSVVSAHFTEGEVSVEFEGDVPERVRSFDRVLVSVGRRPNTDFIGLDATSVETDDEGFLKVDHSMRTTDPHLFAIGDVAGQPMLAHKASREGKVAAEVIAGQKSVFDSRSIPAVVFSHPEIAWCGLTETAAQYAGREVRVVTFPWSASGRAVSQGASNGLTKFILEPETEEILGVGIVGHNAGELIAGGVFAIEMGAVAEDVALTIHPHPTFSETVMETAEVALDASVHRYQPKKEQGKA
ncbi:MAG: dihydrolipoyl dehydrogenase [Armatimonadetes bacterium]|nr:dihydrolipoyl dehydrogenase [Armatimonadota bacterium]